MLNLPNFNNPFMGVADLLINLESAWKIKEQTSNLEKKSSRWLIIFKRVLSIQLWINEYSYNLFVCYFALIIYRHCDKFSHQNHKNNYGYRYSKTVGQDTLAQIAIKARIKNQIYTFDERFSADFHFTDLKLFQHNNEEIQ